MHTSGAACQKQRPGAMEKQKWWGQDSGLADLQEKINTASCGEQEMGDCPRPRKETTDGLCVIQGVPAGPTPAASGVSGFGYSRDSWALCATIRGRVPPCAMSWFGSSHFNFVCVCVCVCVSVCVILLLISLPCIVWPWCGACGIAQPHGTCRISVPALRYLSHDIVLH